MTQPPSLLTPLSEEQSATVQGGHRRYWATAYRPFYYYSQPVAFRFSAAPCRNYRYGYGGYGNVTQTVNVNVQYDD